ncbi:MAG: ion transporter [Pseudomonadaceae bacterium]|nr:ion transporter [Pseudomonadaceae bacterium]
MEWAKRIVDAKWFSHGITAVIVINAIVIGLDTSEYLHDRYFALFEALNFLFLAIFIVEAVLKMAAHAPSIQNYFKSGWNIFDFSIIVISLLPATGNLAMIARLARLLRVLRLVSTLPGLRLIVSTLMYSVPAVGNVVILLSILFYVYGVAGYHLFHEIDPVHWETLGISLLTLFRIVTLEDWTDVMYNAMAGMPFAWVFFVSFVVLGTFVVINLFIAVVLNSLDEAKAEQLREITTPPNREEILIELRETQRALVRLQTQLEASDEHHRGDKAD